MSVLMWAEPPVKESRLPAASLYVIPDFGDPQPGEITDLRWTHAVGTHNKHKGAIAKALGHWLDDHPSYWVLVGEYTRKGERKFSTGWAPGTLDGNDILHVMRDGNIYARSRLDLGGTTAAESLQAALDGENGAQEAVLTLPKLTKDPFGWTEAELNLAVATARDWLYPTEELVAA